MMENLIVNNNQLLNTTNFIRVGDLSYFEGPILTLFEELHTGYLYLFDWIDRDEHYNRWLIYRVSPKSLLQFIQTKISHLELFEKRPTRTVYFTDIDSKNKPCHSYDAFEIADLPTKYYPNSDNLFDVSDCKSFDTIKSVIINSLSRHKLDNEYPAKYSIKILKQLEGKSIYFNQISSTLTDSKQFLYSRDTRCILLNNFISNEKL